MLQTRDNSEPWLNRNDSAMPFQTWSPFAPNDHVEVRNVDGLTAIGQARLFWWGYEIELGQVGSGVIVAARRVKSVNNENE